MIKQYSCNAETLDSSKKCFLNNYGQAFHDGVTQSAEKARSGKYCSKLTKEFQYGMTATISEAKTGECYRITVWKYDNNNSNSGVVVSAVDANKYFSCNTKSIIKEANWSKLQVDFVVPENLNNQDILIFCWNYDKELPAYFDDLSIENCPK